MADIVELMKAWLECFDQGKFDAFPGTVSPDFVLRLPFVPEGVPNEIRGREAARAALEASARSRTKIAFSNVRVLRTAEPDLVVTTCDGEATMSNGNIYRNSYVMFTRIRDGAVLEHTEYLNPLAVTASMGA